MQNGFEYVYSPRVNGGRAAGFTVALAFSGVFLGIASVEKSFFSPFFSVMAAFFLVLSVLLAVRFIGTRFVYMISVDPRGEWELTVRELRGFFGKNNEVRVDRTVCRVSLLDIGELSVFDRDDKNKKKLRALKRRIRRERAPLYNYAAEMFPPDFAVLKISDGDGVSYIKFSPDAELIRILSK